MSVSASSSLKKRTNHSKDWKIQEHFTKDREIDGAKDFLAPDKMGFPEEF